MNFINIVYAHTEDANGFAVDHTSEMMDSFSGAGMFTGLFVMILFWVLLVNSKILNNKNMNEKKIYVCIVCGFEYEEKQWADKCEAWCREKKSCNLDIIKHGRPGRGA